MDVLAVSRPMEICELVHFVDEAVYIKTGKRLNDLQRGIIEGTLKRQKYSDIAETYGCSSGHAKDVGYELLQMLSDIFKEPIDKRNLKAVLERPGNVNIFLGDRGINSIDNNIVGCINVGIEQVAKAPEQEQSNTPDLRLIKKLRQFGLSNEQIAEALSLPLELIELLRTEE